MESSGNKENLAEIPTPRRSTRIAKSLMMQELPRNDAVASKTPKKVGGTPRKTPKKTPKESSKKTPKKTPGKSVGKKQSKADVTASATPRSVRKTPSRSTLRATSGKEVAKDESTRKNLFPDDADTGKSMIKEFEESMEVIDEHRKAKEEALETEKEASNDSGMASPPEDPQMEVESHTLENIAKSTDNDDKLTDESCVIINDSPPSNNAKMLGCNNRESIIVIPDTPMPAEVTTERKLDETFSPEPAESIFKSLPNIQEEKDDVKMTEESPKQTFRKTPVKKMTPKKLLNVEGTLGKMSNFVPLVASSALKSSILLDNKFLSPLKSIRKRSFSTNDVDTTKKINHVTFHSPANMEITVDEIDEGMRPHIDEIRQEREAFVTARAQEKKLSKRRKRSMSNVETEAEKRIAEGRQKTPVKRNTDLGKMPNFKAIHAATFKKMENLVDYKNRKDERAKILLSASGKSSAAKKDTNEEEAQLKDANTSAMGDRNVQENTVGSSAAAGTSRPLNRIEDRQQKWRSMHKSGRNEAKSGTSQKAAAMLKGVRTNRRFDLMMKFRETQN